VGGDGPVERWKEIRERIRRDVLEQGYDRELNAFVQYYGSKEPDASLLLLPEVGFIAADDPRMIGTVDLIRSRLEVDGLIHRYQARPDVDGLPPGEGAFLLCTFWLADNLALQQRWDEATEVFERLLSLRNDVGLLAEEYDPAAARMLGNFPQAFSHTGLINTAFNLQRRDGPARERARS
ncbi:MAG TPA: glycoside hydrolase family 15 protein, partial [Thermoanaerobaculia bacterium]|nr:glycoside hydrolase family 15 protein [Thermoanaerobaculia bacterium]